MKSLSCRDAGVDCDWKATGKDEKEILSKAEQHARQDHGIKEVPKELMEKAKTAIRDVKEKVAS